MNNLKSILGDEVIKYFREMLDPNNGGMYQPPGLNPSHVRLFENEDELYMSSLDDDYWNNLNKKFPGYNIPGNDEQTNKAVTHILSGMKKKYPDQDWNAIENKMKSKIHGGITE